MAKVKLDDVLDFYSSLIGSIGLKADDDGLISANIEGVSIPSTINDKRLVLPTRTILRAGNWEDYVAFHPLSEKVHRGESDVLKKLRTVINFRLMSILSLQIIELTELAVDKDKHATLTPRQQELLAKIPNADAKTLKDFNRIINATELVGEHRLASIYLKKGGQLRGEGYSCVGVVTFPITEFFDEPDEKTIFGIKLRVKDYAAFQELFDYLVPNAWSMEQYSRGSRSPDAPYLDALLSSFYSVGNQLNKTTKLFKTHFDNPKAMMMDMAWEDYMGELSELKALIPPLEGNDGPISMEERETVDSIQEQSDKFAKPVSNRLAAMAADTNITTRAPTAPHQATTDEDDDDGHDGISWNQLQAKKQAAQTNMGYQQPMPGFQPPQQQGFQQQPPQQQWGQQPQPQNAPPGFGGAQYNPNQQQPGHFQQPQRTRGGFAVQQQPQNQNQGFNQQPNNSSWGNSGI